ncbi:MAG TPA: cytochrome c-type biogenesis protein [Usitatibacter sp.]|jgi:cytochrome c-type biogenesis protein CcmH|nr:cytochrome c-type biogenesis protein [Usitatibacter sp.]
MRAIFAALLLALSTAAFAQADEVAHPDPRVERRLKDLGEELRCLVCQNETLAVSQAPLALDLRNEIRALIRQGRSDDEIRAYLVARYGDFVLYKPPFKATTALLWLGPFALLALGIALMFVILRRRKLAASAPSMATDERRQQIASLLESDNAP